MNLRISEIEIGLPDEVVLCTTLKVPGSLSAVYAAVAKIRLLT